MSAFQHRVSRRDFIGQSLLASGVLLGSGSPLVAASTQSACTLGFSTYGMKTLKVEEAVRTIAEIGYDSVEITVWPDWDAAPANMPNERREAVRRLIAEQGSKLVSLMEHIVPSDDDAEHAIHLERLEGVFELANDLAGDQKPLVQTVLGGGDWEQKKTLFLDRLGDWLELANKHDIVLAIKPHRGGGMSRPSEAVWLIEQLGKPQRLRMVYDYSHYAFRDMPLDQTVAAALPYTAHVAVKDAVEKDGRVRFELPGSAGTIDFARIIKLLHAGGYRGDINCEVSGMVWNQKGYDPIAAAKQCYANVSKAFEKAGVARTSNAVIPDRR